VLVVVLWPDTYPVRQKAVLKEFLSERRYVSSAIGSVSVAVRPDRFERFVRNRTPK
jgi:hypothetical protein